MKVLSEVWISWQPNQQDRPNRQGDFSLRFPVHLVHLVYPVNRCLPDGRACTDSTRCKTVLGNPQGGKEEKERVSSEWKREAPGPWKKGTGETRRSRSRKKRDRPHPRRTGDRPRRGAVRRKSGFLRKRDRIRRDEAPKNPPPLPGYPRRMEESTRRRNCVPAHRGRRSGRNP